MNLKNILLAIILSLTPLSAVAQSGTYNGLTWSSDNSGIDITGYIGTDANVTVPSQINGVDVVEIANDAFYADETLVSVTLPDHLLQIDFDAFYYCENLTTVTLYHQTGTIDPKAFEGSPVTLVYVSNSTPTPTPSPTPTPTPTPSPTPTSVVTEPTPTPTPTPVDVTPTPTPIPEPTPTPTPNSIGSVRLINISTRGAVGTGANILIAGFVVSGNIPETVLIRADGPALAGFGVSGTLSQPVLSVYNGQTVIATNTGWSTGVNPAHITAADSQVGAFSIANGSGDSALLLTLEPGTYTAQVAGANNTTGVALVEVYEVPSE
jgi:hypothetical protein